MKYTESSSGEIELHEEQPRGWYIVEEVKRLYDNTAPDGTRLSPRLLNAEEMMLLSKINALCKRKKGCTASNKWLAKWWDKSKRWVTESLARFEELNLIVVEMAPGNRRTIRTTFQGDGVSQKSAIAIAEKCYRVSQKSARPTDILERHRKKDTDQPMAGGVDFGLVEPSHIDETAARFIKRYFIFASEQKWLHGTNGFTVHGAFKPGTPKRWAKRINLLLESFSRAEVIDSMKWYFEHWADKGSPECRTLPSFCDKYQNVKSAILRAKQKTNPQQEEDDIGHGHSITQEELDAP